MSSYDFDVYFRQRFPERILSGTSITIQILTGGLANHTVRVKFDPPISTSFPLNIGGLNGTHELLKIYTLRTAVLKHAPPYIASDPSQPFPVTRQLVEKQALQLLNDEDEDFAESAKQVGLGGNFKRGIVKVPKLIWHDEEENVLWIEDLGNMVTLSQVLLAETQDEEEEIRKAALMNKIATELGSFVVEMYRATSNPPEAFLSYMLSLSDRSEILDFFAIMVRDNLKGRGVDAVEASALAERVREGLKDRDEEGVCLGMRDFWSESVLIDLGETTHRSGEKIEPRCGLVDWEFFGGTSAGGELGTFRE